MCVSRLSLNVLSPLRKLHNIVKMTMETEVTTYIKLSQIGTDVYTILI